MLKQEIDAKYRSFALKQSSRLFCLLFNFRSLILRTEVKMTIQENNLFKVSPRETWHYLQDVPSRIFVEKFHNYVNYSNGLHKRAQSLAQSYLLNRVTFFDGDLVVDCGANVGDLKLFFDFEKIAIEYVGIEPSLKTFECLRQNVYPAEVHNVALSDKTEISQFFISEANADSSLIEPVKYEKRVDIKAIRLDEMMNRRIKLLKVEAEGAEIEVLRGATGLFELIDWITVDVGFERGVNRQSTLVDVTNLLYGYGYELVDFGYPRLTLLFCHRSSLI